MGAPSPAFGTWDSDPSCLAVTHLSPELRGRCKFVRGVSWGVSWGGHGWIGGSAGRGWLAVLPSVSRSAHLIASKYIVRISGSCQDSGV